VKLTVTRFPVRFVRTLASDLATSSSPTWITPFMSTWCGVQMYW
jgi:hypothetical protein